MLKRKLYLVKILRAKKSRIYNVEYVHYDDQYTEGVAHERLLKYDEDRHDKIHYAKGNSKTCGIVDVTFTSTDSKSYNFICSIACTDSACFIAETTESTAYGRFGTTVKLDWIHESDGG